MNEITRKCIEKHVERIAESFRTNNHDIEKIIEEFRFSTQKRKNPDACPCYSDGPCHDMDGKLNCFFCFCPKYDNSAPEGGCKLPETGEGKWFYHPDLPTGRIWDCSKCKYPNREETVRESLANLNLTAPDREEVVRKYLKAIFGLDK